MAATTTNPLRNLFSKSPFKPLQEHMATATRCAEQLPELLTALAAADGERVASLKETIFTLENQADAIKNELRGRLPKSLFMPVDRRDLLEILDLQDSIADTAQEIAGLLVTREMTVPPGMAEPLATLTHRCVAACQQANTIIHELDELVETGFSSRETGAVLAMVDALNAMESETDRMGIDLVRQLFAQEESLKPVSVVFWYQLIRLVGNVADYAEKVGDRLRLLVAR